MRVIAGLVKGRKLKGLDGLATRPTTDRVKESIFNIIQFDIEGRKILDLFAGTGQLGIEALSRGAESVTFVDQRTDAVRVIRENLELVGFVKQSKVIQSDSIAFISSDKEKYDVIFLDPPYDSGLLKKSLEIIAEFDILSDGGIIVCETSAYAEAFALQAPYSHSRDYKYGKTKISLYCRD